MSLPREEVLAVLRLSHATGVGPVTFRKLVRVFGSPAAVLSAPRARLLEVPDIGERTANGIQEAARDAWAERELEHAAKFGVSLLCLGELNYPKTLEHTYDPPPILYVKGELRETDALSIAIVGTRHCSHYGRSQAEKLAAGLALAGFSVVSGLARGIDTAAHAGALSANNGRTLCVLGNSLDTVYPADNKKLLERIVDGRGAAISELPFFTPTSAENFPRRNRVIAGLTLGTVVVEGAESSGALITARFAVEMDREVFAVPGPVESPNSRGPHRLIKAGAKLVEDVGDILAELKEIATPLVKMPAPDERLRLAKKPKDETPLLDSEIGTLTAAAPDARPAVSELRAVQLNPRERAIFELLDAANPRGVDQLIEASGLKAHEVLATLMVLEVRRLCRQLPGKRFVKA